MKALLCGAIRERRVLALEYEPSPGTRVVEPHALGVARTGDEMLVAWQLSGPSISGAGTGWKNFRVSRLRNVVTAGTFLGPRPEYSRGTVQLAQVLCQL